VGGPECVQGDDEQLLLRDRIRIEIDRKLLASIRNDTSLEELKMRIALARWSDRLKGLGGKLEVIRFFG